MKGLKAVWLKHKPALDNRTRAYCSQQDTYWKEKCKNWLNNINKCLPVDSSIFQANLELAFFVHSSIFRGNLHSYKHEIEVNSNNIFPFFQLILSKLL